MHQKSFFGFAGFRDHNLKPVPSINSGQALSEIEGSKPCPQKGRRSEILKWVGLVALAIVFALCGPVTHAQQTGKVPRIGFLDNSTASSIAVFLEAFRQELSKLGWIEGKNITIEYRFAEQKNERLPELAADLVRLKVDLIVTSGGTTPLAAKKATSTIPIVMTQSTDPVREGLVASLALPGGNVTGLSGLSPELNTKRLEVLKDAVPTPPPLLPPSSFLPPFPFHPHAD